MKTLPAKLQPEQVRVIVDSREKRPYDLSPLKTTQGTLPTGDYILEAMPNEICIERKSGSDLLGCVGTSRVRFDREITRMLAFRIPILLVEASWEWLELGNWPGKVTPTMVVSSLVGWMCRGISVICVDGHERAAMIASKLLYITAKRRCRELRSLLADRSTFREL